MSRIGFRNGKHCDGVTGGETRLTRLRITPAAEREALVRAYPESGLTQKAFAKKEGVKYSTFVSWVQAQRRQRPRPKLGFTELTLPRAVSGVAPLEVQLADGTVIRGSRVEEVARLL